MGNMKFWLPFCPRNVLGSDSRIFSGRLASPRARCTWWGGQGHHASRLVMTIFLIYSIFVGAVVCHAVESVKKEEKKGTKVEASDIPDNIQIPFDKPKTDEEMEQLANFILKGIENENQKKYLEAADFYSKALKIDEESAIALIRRGICYTRLNRNKEAADDIWNGLHQKPKTVGDFAAMAWVRATSPIKQFRDGSVAVAFGRRALKENETVEHYDVLAAGYAEMGNFEKARETSEKGIKYFPDSPRVAEMKNRLELYKEKKKYREDWGIKDED